MAIMPRTRLVNPRLGIYFGIVASAIVGLTVVTLINEQLGFSDIYQRVAMFVIPVAIYCVIGAACYSREPLEYFATGRRVPSVYCGLGIAMTALGATGLVCLTGTLFVTGFDALCLFSGTLAGFVVMGLLLAPFLRKFGTFTVPSYLGRRFDSRLLRTMSAAVLSVPLLLMLAAELSVGIFATSWLTGMSEPVALMVLLSVLGIALFGGGMRALTWTNVAQAIAILLAIVVPVAIVAILLGYLPVPQLSLGPLQRAVGRQEMIANVPVIVPHLFDFQLPENTFVPIAQRFSEPFASVGPAAYVIATLTVMAGVASAPWLLPRVATAPGVYEARKSLGWAAFFYGITILTLISVAVVMRSYLMNAAVSSDIAALNPNLQPLAALGFLKVDPQSGSNAIYNVLFQRDTVLLALPSAAGLPKAFAYLGAAGVIAAALSAAGATVVAMTNVLAEDVLNGASWEAPRPKTRLALARVSMIAILFAGAAVVWLAPSDPLRLVLWALALTGAAMFPVLVCSIWWKRVNAFGAFAGVGVGFLVCTLAILLSEAGLLGLHSALASAIALPLGTAATIVVSLMTPSPSRHSLELIRDIRIPGGEILYDREMRLLRLRQRQRQDN